MARSELDASPTFGAYLRAARVVAALTLDILSDDEAQSLLAARLGRERLEREPMAGAQLARLCGGLPLALSLLAARAASRAGFPLAAFVAELENTNSRLTVLDATCASFPT